MVNVAMKRLNNTDNVPHGFAGHTGSRATFAKPSPKPPRFGPNQPTLALYSIKQAAISF
jgi:hypothetical protein